MSASPMARQATGSQAIPTRKVFINDPSELPSHYSSTPGGTLYSTTPGGTKIVYEKSFLLNLRNSPISKTPPLHDLPNNILRGASPDKKIKKNIPHRRSTDKNIIPPSQNSIKTDEDQFHMDL